MLRMNGAKPADYTDVLELDSPRSSPASPARSARRTACRCRRPKSVYQAASSLADERTKKNPAATGCAEIKLDGKQVGDARRRGADRRHHQLHQHLESLRDDGGGPAGAQCREAGLKAKPWVKTSLAPGSRVVTDYLTQGRLVAPLEKLGFNVVGYGCTTCIGNSGPLQPEISAGIKAGDIVVTSVLSGNRNFEGRVHPQVNTNYLASPPLVVAYALAGTMDIDLQNDPLGTGPDGKPVLLADIWPSHEEVATPCDASSTRPCSARATPTCSPAKTTGRPSRSRSARSTSGRQVHLRAQAALLRRHDHDAASGHGHQGRARASRCSATR